MEVQMNNDSQLPARVTGKAYRATRAKRSMRKLTPVLLSSLILGGFIVTGTAQQNETTFHPDASVVEIMDAVVMSSADVLWQAGSIISSMGDDGQIITIDNTPQTDEDWERLRWSAINLAEASNLLVIPGREMAGADMGPVPEGELSHEEIAELVETNWAAWTAFSTILHQSSLNAIQLIDNRDIDGLVELGGIIDENCESCHQVFWYPED